MKTLENIEAFRKSVQPRFVKGQQHNNMPWFVGRAKFFKLEAREALSQIKNMWQGKFEEERSFWDAWKVVAEPDTHYGDKKTAGGDEKREDDAWKRDMNVKFRKFVENAKVVEKDMEIRDTSLLRYFFKRGDWIHITHDAYDKCENASDVLTLMKKEKPLKYYQLMSLAAFRDGDGLRRNANVKENRLLLLECDTVPLEFQVKFFSSLVEFGLPVKSITFSGKKSIHCLLKIHPMDDTEEYKRYCEEVFAEFNKLKPDLVDKADKDGVRYSRSPFGVREDTQKLQKMIWCDGIEMDDEKFDFEDTLEQVKRFVANFTCQVKEQKKLTDANGRLKYEFVSSLSSYSDIEDVFMNNGSLMIKTKGQELQRINRQDVWDRYSGDIDRSVIDILKAGKDNKHQYISVQDFYFEKKDIVYDISRKTDDPNAFNLFEPGFYTKCIDMDVKEMPSEFDKLLSNLADERCKEWLVNHMACYFHLLCNGFKHQLRGDKHPLETVPVFYGKSGTGKNTLMDVLGRAICKKGATDISISNLNDDFNEFYKAGLININEAAKGKTERKASKEALKRFTDIWKQLNQKFMPKVDLFNGAYKTISANESIYGVLDIDEFDRRFQYITGGWQIDGTKRSVVDMKELQRQEKDFIAYLIHRDCNFEEAEKVFDNQAKIEDKIASMSNPDMIAWWVAEHIDAFPGKSISARTAVAWYNDVNGTKIDVNAYMMGKSLAKYFTEKKQGGEKDVVNPFELKRGEVGYVKSSFTGFKRLIDEL